ncbi:MFS transporter [Brevundimonas diminuta]|uniref:MFS transporter n=1 Tax=Brevundimonas diminuta TaxID=293 RepID=UPI002097FBE5|nr:MFS transporter [Brevundimonas diminuta]MCO8019180.1 MFS transporter [Brevundimonas diminuta]MCO8021857.1 MFS transporter [Brevundimonas diminuta]
MSEPAHSGLPQPRRKQAIIAISLGTALLVVDNSIATVALPTIAENLGVTAAASVSVVTVYQLVLLMAILPFSALGDRIGHKRLYQSGQMLFLAASLASALATNLPFLLLARATQALGVAAALSVSSALLRKIYPSTGLGRGFGLNSIIIASSAAFAPTIGGLILAQGAWQWVFAAAAPFAALSLALGRSLPTSAPSRAPYDLVGAAGFALVSGSLITGLQAVVGGQFEAITALLITFGLIGGVLFVQRERRQAHPILPVDLLSRPIFALSTSAALAAFTASMCFLLSLPFRLKTNLGMEPAQIGLLMAAWPLAMMVVAPFAGRLSDKASKGLLGGLGMTTAALGLILMGFAGAEATTARLAIFLAIGGAGFGLFAAPNAHQIVSSAPPHRTASAGALVSTTRLVGSTLGATVLASLLVLGFGDNSTPSLAAAIFAGIGALCSFTNLIFSRHSDSHPNAEPDHAPL